MLEEFKQYRNESDPDPDVVNLRSDVLVTRRVLHLLDNTKGKEVLDMGCGDGKLSRLLARQQAHVTGIDVTDEQIRFAQIVEQEQKLGVSYRYGDIRKLTQYLQLPTMQFDIILSLMTHLYLTEAELIGSFIDIANHLKTNGRFIYGNIDSDQISNQTASRLTKTTLPTLSGKEFSTTHYRHNDEVVYRAIKEAGLNIVSVQRPLATEIEAEKYPDVISEIDTRIPPYVIVECRK